MRAASRLALLVCFAACGPHEPTRTASTTPARAPVASSFDQPAPPAQYRLATSAPSKTRRKVVRLTDPRPSLPSLTVVDPNEGRLVILSGRRIAERSGGYDLADTVGSVPLAGGVRVPSFAGGGFVFWTRQGLYRSQTFLGRLQPLTGTSFIPHRIAFGPGFLLVSSNDGQRLVLDPRTGTARAPIPIGLVDIAASADGRVVAALELGRFTVSLDRNATYREVQDQLGGVVTGLSSDPLGFVLDGGTLVTLSRGGDLVRTNPETPPKTSDPGWPLIETPLEHAVGYGVPRAPGRALVAAGAALAEVDLQNGELVSMGPQLLPGNPDCQLLRQGEELLMKCDTRDALVIVSQLESDRPVVERSFGGSPQVLDGFGQLVVQASCDGSSTPPSLCLRGSGGNWRALVMAQAPADPSPAIPGAPPATPEPPVGYALKADGGAVAFVNDSARKGFIDFKTGQFVAISAELERAIDSRSSCVVELGGTLRCLTRDGPLSFGPDGKPQPRPFRYAWLSHAGSRVLAVDDQQRLFQSEDFGRSWREVQPPPLLDRTPESGSRCSEAGCRLGPWLRLGWESRQPVALPEPQAVGLPRQAETPRPALACIAPRAPSVAVSPLVGLDTTTRRPGFGNEALPARYFRLMIETTASHQQSVGPSGLRGVAFVLLAEADDAARTAQVLRGTPLSFRLVDYFDVKATKLSTSLPLSELLRVPQSVGSSAPDVSFEDETSFQPLPVLSRDAGKAAGFLLSHESAQLWVSARQTSVLPLEVTDVVWGLQSAVAELGGGLALLIEDGAGKPRVLRMSGGASSQLFAMPSDLASAGGSSTPDALAVSQSGDLAVLRFTASSVPPSIAYPVLAYRPGQPVEALAPWSTLRPASDPSCADKSGYRALVMPAESWLTLVRGGEATDQDWGMIAALRWSKERVCLEAVELADQTFMVAEEELQTRVTASFVGKPEAARLGFALGLELRQPLTCELRAQP